MVAPMTNEIHLSKAELEIATTCSDKPALDYSETSCSNNAVKQCYTCKSWQGDKAKVLRQIETNPDCMDKFKGWPESGGCGIHYEWLEITILGDARADIEVPANFGCNYWN